MAEGDIHIADSDLYPYPGSTRSKVWTYFGFRKKGEGPPCKSNLQMDTVICKLCKKSYANKGNTTNLQFHLEKHHKYETETESNSEKRFIQTKVNSMPMQSTKGKISREKKKTLDDLALKFIVGKALPISTTDNRHFKAFVKELDPRYTPPSRYQIYNQLKEKKTCVSQNIKKELPQSSVALTHDGWTSCATESFNTVTAHFITEEWDMRSVVLHTTQVQGSHTSEKIAEGLQETVSSWKLPVPIVVTDNAANEKKALELLGWERCGCYGHRINLIVKHSLDFPDVSKILSKCRKLVSHFHRSTSLNDCLMEKQMSVFSHEEEVIGHKLIADVPTRWNSSLDMLERILEQMPAIMAVASDTKLSKSLSENVRSSCLSFDEQSVVENLIEVLTPFKKATLILCAENCPTMNKVLVTLAKLKMALQKFSTTPVVKRVAAKMEEELFKRAKSDEEIPLLAAMLSPDTKSLNFLPDSERIAAHQLLMTKALSMVDKNKNLLLDIKREKTTEGIDQISSSDLPSSLHNEVKDVECVQNAVSPAKKLKCTDLEEWLDDVYYVSEERESPAVVIEREVSMYLGSKKSQEDLNLTLLQWWKKHQYMFPRLSMMAKKYLGIPASSVPSERVFSLAGNLVNKKRSRMKPALVDSLIFLKMNMDLYWNE